MTLPFIISSIKTITGGTILLCRLPGSKSPINDDLHDLIQLNPVCIISLTPLEELNEKGGMGLPELVKKENILWLHFPIVDYSYPSIEQSNLWDELSIKLHSFLDEDKTIVFHCLAGIGRSGTVALRLLVERGEDHLTALERLRLVRPGAVETLQQMEWATNLSSQV